MSTTAPGGGADGGADKRRSLGKYVKRMSSVFKRDKPSKAPATSTSTTTTPMPTSTAAAPTASTPIASTSAPTTDPKLTAISTQSPAPAAAPEEPVTQTLNRSALQQERARALFAKYGLTLESHEWIAAPAQSTNVQRVEKPIRMRVHRSCHHCGMSYGADKICAGCEHKRCKKCPRYPKKRTPAEKGKETEATTKPKKKRVLTVTSKTGNELVYQHAKQRVRRTCHKCETMFIPPTSTICENCRHIRCTKCPREPAKPNKWPHGYPGDVDYEEDSDIEKELARVRRTWRKPRIRVRWECEGCNSLFHEGSAQCPGCGHERCEKCKRTPLKKVKMEPEFDPDIVRAVEEKLKALVVHEDPPAPGTGGT